MLEAKNNRSHRRYQESHLETILKGLMLPANKIVQRGI